MQKFVKILKIILPLFLGVFLCWYAYSKFTPEQLSQIKTHFKSLNYNYLAISILCGVLSHISRGLRWAYQLSPLGYTPKKYNLVASVFIGYLLNFTIPRSGEVSRALLLNRYEKIPFDKSFGTIIGERIIDTIILLLLVISAFLLQFDVLYNFLSKRILLENFLYILLGLFLLSGILFWWLYTSKHPIIQRIIKLFSGVKEGVLSILKSQHKWHFIGHTLFIWLMYILMFYIPFFSLEQTQNIALSDMLTAFVVGSFAIVFTNGGFGSYPLFIAEILLIFGITYPIGTALGWAMWIAQFLMVLVFGGLAFLLLPILNSSKK